MNNSLSAKLLETPEYVYSEKAPLDMARAKTHFERVRPKGYNRWTGYPTPTHQAAVARVHGVRGATHQLTGDWLEARSDKFLINAGKDEEMAAEEQALERLRVKVTAANERLARYKPIKHPVTIVSPVSRIKLAPLLSDYNFVQVTTKSVLYSADLVAGLLAAAEPGDILVKIRPPGSADDGSGGRVAIYLTCSQDELQDVRGIIDRAARLNSRGKKV